MTQSKTSFYQRYLVADQMQKRIIEVGALPGHVILFGDTVEISLGWGSTSGMGPISAWSDPERREAAVNEFLERWPDTTIDREPTYSGGRPQMVLSGVAAHGIKWRIDFRDGVCEMVQVGTKKVESVDPEAYAALPKTETYEPVYEYRCPDPIVAAGLS